MSAEDLADNAKTAVIEIARRKPQDTKGVFVETIALAGTMTPGVMIDTAIANV